MPNTTHSWAMNIIEYYKQGYSDAEVAAEMSIPMREFNTMLTDNPTFAKLVDFGRTLSLAWWESQARKNINNKNFNYSVWALTMKNKFGWADKVETSNNNENTNYSLDELRSQIDKKLKKLAKNNTLELADAQRVLQPAEPKDGVDAD